MVQSAAKTVAAYLKELPADRREAISQVRAMILKNLPKGYEETMNWGMICYEIPLKRYPNTYNGQPTGIVALASQKNYMALYLMCEYTGTDEGKSFKEAYEKTGKKLDMGKCCIRFKKADDLALDAIGDVIANTSVEKCIKFYEKSRALIK
ncbi:MAG: DUF1801 domain-containing protein [Patescibacteria group bacterium]